VRPGKGIANLQPSGDLNAMEENGPRSAIFVGQKSPLNFEGSDSLLAIFVGQKSRRLGDVVVFLDAP
jgi:hypothetical protein